MQHPAQIQAAIELLEQYNDMPIPVDKLMASFFKSRRYIGAKDKGVIADTIYTVFRRFAEIMEILSHEKHPQTPRAMVITSLMIEGENVAEIFAGTGYGPAPLDQKEQRLLGANLQSIRSKMPVHSRLNVPEWSIEKLKDMFGEHWKEEALALHGRAPTDIRANVMKTNRKDLLSALKRQEFNFENTSLSPTCLRMKSRKSLFGTEEFKKGFFEIQDEGSQLIAHACGASRGQKVVDFCAGAGGKTLALAAAMGGKGTLYACDIHERRLGEMPKRLKRAGVADTVRTVLLTSETDKWVKRHKDQMDVVLIDAPCSGSGTWRRSPDSVWKLTEESLENLTKTQASILESACRLVKDGGTFVYATCSVFKEENHAQIEAFLAKHPEFELTEPFGEGHLLAGQKMIQLSPHNTGTDGFFMAKMIKKGA